MTTLSIIYFPIFHNRQIKYILFPILPYSKYNPLPSILITISMQTAQIRTLSEELTSSLSNASIQFRSGDHSSASTSYSEILQSLLDPSTQHPLDSLSDHTSFNLLKSSLLSLKSSCAESPNNLEESLALCNQALSLNKTHELSLLRRSKLYLKLGDVEKGLNDLELFVRLAPDIDIDELLNKYEEYVGELEEGESEGKYEWKKRIYELKVKEGEDEELFLSFCNLKVIDRESKRHQGKGKGKEKKGKKSSVYFGEEEIHQVEVEEPVNTCETKINFTLEEKQSKIEQQIKSQLIENQHQISPPNLSLQPQHLHPIQLLPLTSSQEQLKIISSKNIHIKSILKTPENSCLKIPSLLQIDSVISEPVEILNVLKIKDIEGKIILKSKSEIKFRRSQYITIANRENEEIHVSNQGGNMKSRKSILKDKSRKSDIVQGFTKRKSKFDSISNIDGKPLFQLSNFMNNNSSYKDIHKSNRSLESEDEFNIYGDSKISEEEVNNFVNNLMEGSVSGSSGGSMGMAEGGVSVVSQAKSTTSRKSALKPKGKNSVRLEEKGEEKGKRRTVLFKQIV